MMHIRIDKERLNEFDRAVQEMPALNNRSAVIRLFMRRLVNDPKRAFNFLVED